MESRSIQGIKYAFILQKDIIGYSSRSDVENHQQYSFSFFKHNGKRDTSKFKVKLQPNEIKLPISKEF
jgi:hypothetical protein